MEKHLDKTYRDVSNMVCSLDDTIELLLSMKNDGIKAKCCFNGTWLYSDDVTIDSAYVAVCGGTKSEVEKRRKEEHEKYLREEAEHKSKIPNLTKEYIEKGHKLIDEKYWELWDKCVPIRLDDIYHGMELDCCLEIIQAVNDGKPLREVKTIFYNQGHSGMSASLVASMVKSFHEKGEEVVKYIY